MISLYNTLKESLLSDFDDLEASMDPIKEIKQFIKTNYITKGRLQISQEPNENGKYEVSCRNIEVVNKNIVSLTNGMFEWSEIGGYFYCYGCKSLTSLKGAPKKVGRSFNCPYCTSLTSLEDAPKEVGWSFYCNDCTSLISLEGAPKKVSGDFSCTNCDSLISLEGAPEEVNGNFCCFNCKSLTSLKGAPEKVSHGFYCANCSKQFTEKDVKKVCNTVKIYV